VFQRVLAITLGRKRIATDNTQRYDVNHTTEPVAALVTAAARSNDVREFCTAAAQALQAWFGAAAITLSYDGPDTSCHVAAGAPDTACDSRHWCWTDETGRSRAVLEIYPAPAQQESMIETVLSAAGALATLVTQRELASHTIQRSNALLDASPFAFALVNNTSVITRANAAFAALLGTERADALAGRAVTSLPHSAESGSHEAMLEALRNGTSWTGGVTMQVGDVLRSCDAVLTPLGHQATESLLVLHDRTDDVSEQREIIAREKLATAGEIASGVAHEVNNPLAAIRIEAELIAAGMDNEDTVESAQVIIREVDRASRIAKMLIHLTRRPERELRPIQLNELLLEVINSRSQLDNWRHIDLRLNLEPSVKEFMGPVTDLRQVFFHLLTNAEDAVEKSNDTVIEVGMEHRGDTVRITVSDSGPGVPLSMRQRIFDPFFTTKDPDKGSGLGLTLSHGVIAELGGKIWVEESQLGGARFVVELPYPSDRDRQ
jgi:signal transduction histidine kinase